MCSSKRRVWCCCARKLMSKGVWKTSQLWRSCGLLLRGMLALPSPRKNPMYILGDIRNCNAEEPPDNSVLEWCNRNGLIFEKNIRGQGWMVRKQWGNKPSRETVALGVFCRVSCLSKMPQSVTGSYLGLSSQVWLQYFHA